MIQNSCACGIAEIEAEKVESVGDDRNGEDASEMVRSLGRPERVVLGLQEDAMVGDWRARTVVRWPYNSTPLSLSLNSSP